MHSAKKRMSRDAKGGGRRHSKNLPRRPSVSRKRGPSVNKESRAHKNHATTNNNETTDRSVKERANRGHTTTTTTITTVNHPQKRTKSTENALNEHPAAFGHFQDHLLASSPREGNSSEDACIAQWKKEWFESVLKGGLDPLWEQYKEIVKDTADVSTTIAFNANPTKNRYHNIKCWDTTRVILPDPANDYIHANYVDGYKKDKEFILTQGPIKTTLADFWRMVWSENVVVIVMLCQLQEEKKEKCDPYWDELPGNNLVFGPFDISTISKTSRNLMDDQKIDVYELEVQNKGGKATSSTMERRNIILYNYKSWPDKGVPRSETVLIQLYRKFRQVQRNMEKENSVGNSPMLVHCSAGVGRTGCFVGLAICYNRLEATGKVDVGAVIKNLRRQRALTIQNGLQYLYLHLVLIAFIGKQNQIDYTPFKQSYEEKYEKTAVN